MTLLTSGELASIKGSNNFLSKPSISIIGASGPQLYPIDVDTELCTISSFLTASATMRCISLNRIDSESTEVSIELRTMLLSAISLFIDALHFISTYPIVLGMGVTYKQNA